MNSKMGIKWSQINGLLYCFLYALMITVQSNVAKFLTNSSASSYINFVRCLFQLFAVPLIEFHEATACDSRDLLLYLTSAICSVGACCTAVLSFTLMGVGDSTAIEFGGGVILVGVIGHFFRDEKVDIFYFILLLIDSLGITLVAKPSFLYGVSEDEEVRSKEVGAAVSLVGAFFFSLFHVCVRKLEQRNNLHCFLFISVQGLVGMALTGAWTAGESAWKLPNTWLSICIFVAYGFVNDLQLFFAVKALVNEEAKNVTTAVTLSVVFSYVLQFTLFDEKLDWVSIVGSIVVICCVLMSGAWAYVCEILGRVRYSYNNFKAYTGDASSP